MTSYQSRPPQTVAKQVRTRTIWDIVVSIVLLILSCAGFLLGSVFAVLSAGFAQDCTRCSVTSASSILIVFGAFLALAVLVGIVVTIVLQVASRRSWWVAAATFVLVGVGWIVGFLVFAGALGGS